MLPTSPTTGTAQRQWLWIDGVWFNQAVSHAVPFVGYETLLPLGSSIAFLMLNLVPLRTIVGREPDDDETPTTSAGCVIMVRFWFYFWLFALFTSCGAAIWIWVQFYWGTWTGVAMFLATVVMLVDAVGFSVCRYYFRERGEGGK